MTVRILCGDCRDVLKTLPDESVHCVMTSPPYFGLRDYGVDGQMGLEATPEDFIAGMVDVFSEVRRVLRADGTAWVNMGDSYATNGGPGWQGKNGQRSDRRFTGTRNTVAMRDQSRTAYQGHKPKDLMGMPWRLAFALRADGWWLRQDIIWHKPNPMPESILDRCTKAHEYVFLLSKSERYYFDAEAIKEPASHNTHERQSRAALDHKSAPDRVKNGIRKMKMPDGWDTGPGGHGSFHRNGREKGQVRVPGNKTHRGATAYEAGDEAHRTKGGLVDYSRKLATAASGIKNNTSFDEAMAVMPDRRNKRSVWTIATEPFPEAHFATFPTALAEPCILAGCPVGGVVLDPFSGAGTTGLVADRLGRDAILIELNPQYADMAERRIKGDSPLFAEVSA